MQLTNHEVASRISYAAIGGPPDAELANAADATKLKDDQERRRHIARLLQTEQGKERIWRFFDAWLAVGIEPDLTTNNDILAGIRTDGLAKAMSDELRRFVEHTVFGTGGRFRDLLLSKEVFTQNQVLAKLYDASVAQAGASSQSTRSLGLILRAPILVTSSEPFTSPILRGVKVRRDMLCDDLPSPPPEIVAARDDQLSKYDPRTMTNRDKTTILTDSPACMSCHSLINPVGFVLKEFDPIGRFRTHEKVLDENEALIATHKVNTVVAATNLDVDTPPVRLTDSQGLLEQVAVSSKSTPA